MKKTLIIIAASVAAASLASCGGKANTPHLESQNDTLSWVLGENTAKSLQTGDLVDINQEIFIEAIRTTLEGRQQPINDTQYNEALSYLMQMAQMKQLQQAKNTASAEEDYFRQLTASNPNVKKHEMGFYYEQLTPGKGPNAKYAQRVGFDYRSYIMLTGEPYDQTYGQRDPINSVVGAPMFPALIEALQLMNAGSKYRFYFTSKQTSGVRGMPTATPLIYEIELHYIAD